MSITEVRVGETSDSWQALWEKPAGKLRLTMLGGDTTQIISAVGYGAGLSPRPMIIARREATGAEYLVIMEIYQGERSVKSVDSVQLPDASGMTIRRTSDSGREATDRFFWRADTAGAPPTVIPLDNDHSFQAQEAFFRAGDDGQVVAMLMLDGTHVKTGEMGVGASLPTDVAVERAPDGIVSVVQTSGSDQTLTVQNSQWEGSQVRIFALAESGEVVEKTPGEAEQAEAISWQAESGVVYFLGTEPPGAEWLARYSVRVGR